MPRLTAGEAALSGFTDELVIGYEEFLAGNAGTLANDETYTITYAVPTYTIVERVWMIVDEAFSSAATVDIGDSSDADGYLNPATAISVANVAHYNNGAYFTVGGDANTANGRNTSSDIELLFTPVSSTSLNNLTSGKLTVKMKLSRTRES